MPTPPHWPAPTATGAVDAVIELPGSKSMTNRALVLAALAAGPSVIRRPLRSRDTLLMATALRSLGTGPADDDAGDWRPGGPGRAPLPPAPPTRGVNSGGGGRGGLLLLGGGRGRERGGPAETN